MFVCVTSCTYVHMSLYTYVFLYIIRFVCVLLCVCKLYACVKQECRKCVSTGAVLKALSLEGTKLSLAFSKPPLPNAEVWDALSVADAAFNVQFWGRGGGGISKFAIEISLARSLFSVSFRGNKRKKGTPWI